MECAVYTLYIIFTPLKKKPLNSKFHIHGFHFILLTKKRLFIYNFCYIKHNVFCQKLQTFF